MSLKNLEQIEADYIKKNGVQALADRPNAVSLYGTGGLNQQELKKHFDNAATKLIDKINELQKAISGELVLENSEKASGASFIHVRLEGYSIDNLEDLINSFSSGYFANELLKLYPSASDKTLCELQTIIYDIAQNISNLSEKSVAKTELTFDSSTSSLVLKLLNDEGEALSSHTINLQITTERIVDQAVIASKIASCAVTSDKIAAGNVKSEHIAGESVTEATIGTGAVTTSKIADNAITSEKIDSKAVTGKKLSDDVNSKIDNAFTGCNVDYDKATGIFKLTFYNNAGEGIVREIDANIESAIVDIDDYVADDGSLHLCLTLAAGEEKTKDICLNDIFVGYVKRSKEPYKIYGTDNNGDDTSYFIDTPSNPVAKGAVVKRTEDGNVIVPGIDSETDYAAPLGFLTRIIDDVEETLDRVIAIQNEYIGGVT